MFLFANRKSRQKVREAWSREKLLRTRSIALGFALERSTSETYNSATQSYLSFCKLHQFPLEPTPDTLSFFVVYMAHHINPSSVASYLSGISSTLEPHFPNIRSARQTTLVTRTLAGCRKQFSTSVHRKSPLPLEALHHANDTLSNSASHDDLLFLAMLSTGFFALLRLGELASPDNPKLRTARKIIMRHTIHIDTNFFGFTLPYHKADRFFEGNEVRIQRQSGPLDPRRIFLAYLSSRDKQFSYRAELWIRRNSELPTRTWFLAKLHSLIPDPNIAGHSLRSGGATYYAIQGVPDNIIQKLGRWASDSFQVYIRKHPAVLHALMHDSPAL